jgi:hypothetical protein
LEQRRWLRCDIDSEGSNVLIVLANRNMLETACRRGNGEPLILDATHGLQRYGLKLVTAHVVDEEFAGKWHAQLLSWFACMTFVGWCTCGPPAFGTQLQKASMLQGTFWLLADIEVLSLCNADFSEINAFEWHRQLDIFLNNANLHMHLDAGGCNEVLKMNMYAGRPVVWALVRHETAQVYSTILGDLKDACDGILQLQHKECLRPSCVLVDNSNAEISAARCAPPLETSGL